VFGFFFNFTYFIVRGALFTVFRSKKIAVTSNLERIGDLRTRLKINWKPVCPRRDFVRKYDRYQSLLLCTPLVYMHEHGPYKSIKKNVNEVSLHISGWTNRQG
jgi:hypothetical protein